MKRSPMRQRYKPTGPDFETRLRVYERDGRCCVRCGTPARGENGFDYSLQHRKKRSAGVDNRPCNLILLCGSGTTGCHGWVEDHPTLAADEGGWSVSAYADPATVPVLVRTRCGEHWKYLGDDFAYHDNPPERAFMSQPILSPDHPAMQAIGDALAFAERWASVEGQHHKQWVIDQMVRALAGVDYDDWVAAYNADDEYESWQTGIAP